LQWTVPCAKDHALFSPGKLRRVPGGREVKRTTTFVSNDH
jgi:hypothetical protein